MQDEELREAMRQAREPDREASPHFGATWTRAEESGRSSGRGRVLAGAVAIGAVIAAVIVLWPDSTTRHGPDVSEVAGTRPRPDIPTDEPEPATDEPEPAAEADWTVDALAETPSDFLLEASDTPTGELPSDQLLDDDFDLDDESLREL
jgi:hypothetical protein